jgi:hypothetical protein
MRKSSQTFACTKEKTMNKIKKYFSAFVIFWGAANLSQIALAQYWVPIQPPVPRHDTMFPRRNRSNNNIPSSSSTSKFTSEQVREFANRFNSQLSASPRKQEMLNNICSGNGDSVFQSRGFSPSDIVIFKNQLGC